MSKGRFAIGAIIGTAAGLIAGLLTAPKSGKETRADIKQKAVDLKENAEQKADKIRKRTEEVAGDLKDDFDELRDRVAEKTHSPKDNQKTRKKIKKT